MRSLHQLSITSLDPPMCLYMGLFESSALAGLDPRIACLFCAAPVHIYADASASVSFPLLFPFHPSSTSPPKSSHAI